MYWEMDICKASADPMSIGKWISIILQPNPNVLGNGYLQFISLSQVYSDMDIYN
jgi:hypothetical protein